MPTYEYLCKGCGTSFEERQTIAEHEESTVRCPKCGGSEIVAKVAAFYAKTSKKS